MWNQSEILILKGKGKPTFTSFFYVMCGLHLRSSMRLSAETVSTKISICGVHLRRLSHTTFSDDNGSAVYP